MSLLLLATTLRTYPAPYERALSESRRGAQSELNRRLTTPAEPSHAAEAPTPGGAAGGRGIR
jgi:hypothetical protein